jgi:hypothetical protein
MHWHGVHFGIFPFPRPTTDWDYMGGFNGVTGVPFFKQIETGFDITHC